MYNGQRQVMLLAGHDLSRPGNDHRTVSWDRSRWRDRGRLGRFRDQLHRILHHLLGKLAHVSGNLLIVRFLPGVRGHFASGRTHSHPPAKQGGGLSSANLACGTERGQTVGYCTASFVSEALA